MYIIIPYFLIAGEFLHFPFFFRSKVIDAHIEAHGGGIQYLDPAYVMLNNVTRLISWSGGEHYLLVLHPCEEIIWRVQYKSKKERPLSSKD